MDSQSISRRALAAAFLLVVALLMTTSGSTALAQGPTDGFRALSGDAAANFVLPGDVQLVTSFELPAYGLTYERYQQRFDGANVFGGQLTLYRDDAGTVTTVIGAHYSDIAPTNAVGLSRANARGIVSRDIGAAGQRLVELQINPTSGRYFYRVETRRPASRWIHWIDAGNGAVLNKYNALMTDCDGAATPCGFGVQFTEDAGDIKDLSGLTTQSGGDYQLVSADGRQETHDQGSTNRPFLGPIATDADDSWILEGNESPAQQALVDAHYYANVTDDYYGAVHGYDWVARASDAGANDKMEIHAHYTRDYNNAFWNGSYIALGDGDQSSFEELTALDVIGHELTHGVTDFTSDLIYQDESGALNESFSDMMGSSMEFWAEANGREPATTLEPDWLIGEDFDLRAGENGFRNMADPTEDGDPSHYDDRYTGTDDNGGVHTNSGISNHWYYLLVHGGQNADPDRQSGTDVAGIGLANAEPIAFLGFTALPSDATFCDARASTIGVASSYDANVADAWDEVGVDSALCGGGNAAPTADFTYTTSGLTADFTDQSTDSDGSITAWDWDFGDGNTSTEQNPTHTYATDSTYSVTLTVTDDDGATDSVTQDVTVSESTGTSMHVGDLDSNSINNGSTWTAEVTITIHDDGENLVDGAQISGAWSTGDAVSCTSGTMSAGECTVSLSGVRKRTGSITFTVTGVTHNSLSYNSEADHDPDGDSDGTSITVSKP